MVISTKYTLCTRFNGSSTENYYEHNIRDNLFGFPYYIYKFNIMAQMNNHFRKKKLL